MSFFPLLFNSVGLLIFLYRYGSQGVHYFDHSMRAYFAIPRTGTVWVSVFEFASSHKRIEVLKGTVHHKIKNTYTPLTCSAIYQSQELRVWV